MAYTDEQIQEVCDAGFDIMGKFADVQNCLFPSTAIIKGMKEGKTAEEIGDDAYDAVIGLPLSQGALAVQLKAGDSIHNMASYMRNEIIKRINAIDDN